MLKKMKRALRRPGFENPQRTPLASNAAPIIRASVQPSGPTWSMGIARPNTVS